MATYKVIQDVEAEDKILGPLTLKQLIFAIIMAGFGFGAFRVVSLTGSIFTAIPFLPFMIIFGALAAPLGKNQLLSYGAVYDTTQNYGTNSI